MARKTTKQTNAVQLPLPTPRAALYLRVSTDEQATDGYGLDVQRERTNAQAVAKGMAITETYTDAGISGTKGADERPALARLLADAEAGLFDAVIVLALDRLGRKTLLVLTLIEQLAAAKVALVSCKESLDTSTPQGQFVLTMFAALAQLERDTIVERTTAGRNQRGKVDGEKGGRLPMGYRRILDGVIEIDRYEAETVCRIFDERAAGMTLRDIAAGLNADSILTARGRIWHASSVREVLMNEDAYRGGTRGDSAVRWLPILSATAALEAA